MIVNGGNCGIFKCSCPSEMGGLRSNSAVSWLADSFQLHVKYVRILSHLGIKIIKEQIKM